jgi:hypothetical protein
VSHKTKNIRSRIKNNSIKLKTCSTKCYKKYSSIKSKEAGCGSYREGSGYGKSGYYKGIYCASTYELIFLAFHLEKSLKLKEVRKNFHIFIRTKSIYIIQILKLIIQSMKSKDIKLTKQI